MTPERNTPPCARFLHWAEESKAILICSGEIDISNAARLRDALDTCLSQDPAVLDVDLREVTFLDSSALKVLVDVHHHLNHSGCLLRVLARAHVLRLLQRGEWSHLLYIRAA